MRTRGGRHRSRNLHRDDRRSFCSGQFGGRYYESNSLPLDGEGNKCLKKYFHNPQAVIGLVFILIALFAAISAPVLAPNDPAAVNVISKYIKPCAEYPLGTDQLGRCVLSRLLYGARYSIGMSLPTLVILSVIGLILGSFSACAGRRIDRLVTILCDVFLAFPALVIVAAIIGILGNGLHNIVVAMIIAMWAWFTRMVSLLCGRRDGQGLCFSSRHFRLRYVENCHPASDSQYHAPVLGIPEHRRGLCDFNGIQFLFFRTGTSGGNSRVGVAILSEARSGLYSHPELLIYPGICILLTAAGFNLFEKLCETCLNRRRLRNLLFYCKESFRGF